MIVNDSTTQSAACSESINRCAALFAEADRLSKQAYALLNEPVSTQTIQRFSAAKKLADDKYRQARKEWLKTINKSGEGI